MSSTLGSPPSSVQPAARASTPGWRDPRLWVGVAIVAASVVLGSRLLASADDTVAVWSVSDDAAVGESLSPDDLVPQRVRFADAGQLDRYFTVDDAMPQQLRLLRGLGAGELLPRAALGDSGADDSVEVSLPVSPLLVPPAVAPGSVVDVYLSDRGANRADREGYDAATPALSEVMVVDAPTPEDSFAVSGERQLVLAVAAERVGDFYASLDAMSDPVVTVVRRS